MAEDEKQEKKDESSKKSSKMNLYLVAFIPMVFMFLGFFAVTKFINPRFGVASSAEAGQNALDNTKGSDDKSKEKGGKQGKKGKNGPIMFELEPVLANPLGTAGRRFVKVGISMELGSKELLKELEENKSKLQHLLIIILSSKDIETLNSTEGKILLQEEIRKAVIKELELTEEEIPEIYFSEFIVQ
jgi:flagellar protein FliL